MRHAIPSALMLLAATAFSSAACSAQDADEPAAEPEAAASADTDAEDAAETNADDEAAPPSAEAPSDDADESEADEAPAAEEPADEAPAADEEEAAAADDATDDAGANSEYAALTGDAANGERVFRQCMACHTIQEGVNRVGPSLHGIIGREAGSVDGFRYSPANQNSGVTWTEETLFVYLENPREFIPGTFMAFAGLRDPQQRADVIAYLRENAM